MSTIIANDEPSSTVVVSPAPAADDHGRSRLRADDGRAAILSSAGARRVVEARFGIEQMVREAKETRRHRSACMKRKVDEGKEVVGGHRAAAIGKPLIISPKGVTSQNPDRLRGARPRAKGAPPVREGDCELGVWTYGKGVREMIGK